MIRSSKHWLGVRLEASTITPGRYEYYTPLLHCFVVFDGSCWVAGISIPTWQCISPARKTERAARAAVQRRLDRLLDALQALREDGLLL
jgi:hypothetical protein